jgi:betaine-aldehyde dehydrogenase
LTNVIIGYFIPFASSILTDRNQPKMAISVRLLFPSIHCDHERKMAVAGILYKVYNRLIPAVYDEEIMARVHTKSDAFPRTYGHWIGGSEMPAATFIDRTSPESGVVVSRFAEGSEADAIGAIQAAKSAFDSGTWSLLTGAKRAAILHRWADLVADAAKILIAIEMEEAGKIYRVAKGDIEGTVDLIRYAAAAALTVSGQSFMNIGENLNAFVVKEPIGVVGAIVPWNFPTIIFAQKVPLALAAGCTVVVKPSEFTSGTAIELAKLGAEAGIPPGVLNVVTGYGDPVGRAISESVDVDLVSFTGSTRTGREILKGQQSNFKRVSLELGGKSAAIVFADADLDAAIDGVLFSIYLHQGQVCCAGSRLLVEETIADAFVERLAKRASGLKIGALSEPSTDLGPLISPQHLKLVRSHVEAARSQGAVVACGGEVVGQTAHPTAPFQTFLPTILDNVEPTMDVFRDEIFGPVLTVTRFSTTEEAVSLANQSDYGLAGSVWTSNIQTAFHVAQRVRTGTIEINTCLEGQPQLPFGGYKASGLGREKGQAGLDEFMEVKTIGLRTAPRSPFFQGEGGK